MARHPAPSSRCAAVRGALGAGQVLDLAGDAPLPENVRALAAALMDVPGDVERLELTDSRRGSWRFAALREGRLEAWPFLSTNESALPGGAALAALLDAPVPDGGRSALLAGRAVAAGPADRAVCACFGIGLNHLRSTIVERRPITTDAVGAALGAGTSCGSCLPEIREILRDADAAAA